MPRVIAAALALALATAACSADDGSSSTTTSSSTSTTVAAPGETITSAPPTGGDLDAITLTTEEIAELEEPIAFAARPSSPDLYVAEKEGTIRVIEVTRTGATTTTDEELDYELQTTPILDLSDEVINEGERGLLGIAFSTDGRRLYVDYTAEPDGRTVVAEYELGDRDTVDTDTRRELLTVAQPYPNHNGGHLTFGPDGYLYVGLGDGGSRGDPEARAQDTSDLLGSILRIDPEGGTEDGPTYGIPAGNPFANGVDGAPETWLYGVRNPWRFSFDRLTGDLWIGDVGQNDWEEVDLLRSAGGFDAGRGANLGWDQMEGTHPFQGGENPEGGVAPVYEYGHDGGACSVTGGFVYRGDAIAGLTGSYVFADYCRPGLHVLQVDDADRVIAERRFDLPLEEVISFGEDRDGELFVLLQGGGLVKLVSG